MAFLQDLFAVGTFSSAQASWALLVFRVVVAIIFFVHAYQKLHYWKTHHADVIPKTTLALYRVSSCFEFVASFAILLGLYMHIAVIGLLIIIVGAIYTKQVVWRKHFTGEGGWEFDAILLASLIVLFFLGSGNYSLD